MRKHMLLGLLVSILFVLVMACESESVDGDPDANIDYENNQEEQVDGEGNEGESTENGTESDENGSGSNGIEEEPLEEPEEDPGFVSPYTFEYPEDGVKGVYSTGHSAGGERFNSLLELITTTELNAIVVDIKDDHGYLTFKAEENSPYYEYSKPLIKDMDAFMRVLEEHQIYPIARIVVFKDSVISQYKHEWTFMQNGQVWKNRRGEAFVNPFLKEVWDYNIEVAKMAAELGFEEIQFDYVRFPEGFERRDDQLDYDWGDYSPAEIEDEQGNVTQDYNVPRLQSITDFVSYAYDELEEYNVDVSVDIFGYTAVDQNAGGIGQSFLAISRNVDVISSMIYPSHWGPHYFGIPKPDTEPYRLVQEYAAKENELLAQLSDPPISRPWIQDFTATWLGSGNYVRYGPTQVEDQIRALNEAGIWEYLLWNAGNRYTAGVNYIPIGKRSEQVDALEANAEDEQSDAEQEES